MNIDLDKARKNKIFKVNEKPAEKIIQALILQGFINIAWDVTSQGWELRTQNGNIGEVTILARQKLHLKLYNKFKKN